MQVSCGVHKKTKQLQLVSTDHMRMSIKGKPNLILCKIRRKNFKSIITANIVGSDTEYISWCKVILL